MLYCIAFRIEIIIVQIATARSNMERLPADDPDARSNGQASTSGASDQPTYLLVFPHRLLDFRIPELESVAELAGCKPGELKLLEPFGGEPLAPYWYMTVPSEDIAKKIASRAVLLKVSQLLHLVTLAEVRCVAAHCPADCIRTHSRIAASHTCCC